MNIERTFLDVKSPPRIDWGPPFELKTKSWWTFCSSKTNPLQHLPWPFKAKFIKLEALHANDLSNVAKGGVTLRPSVAGGPPRLVAGFGAWRSPEGSDALRGVRST